MVKAVVMPEPGKVEIQNLPRPKITDETILIDIEISGICGTDIHGIYEGRGVGVTYPLIPGHEIVGSISEIGKKFKRDAAGEPLEEGDRISVCCLMFCGDCFYDRFIQRNQLCENSTSYGWSYNCEKEPYLTGGWAEQMYIFPKTWVYKLPKNMPLEVAVLIEPFSITLRAIERAMTPGIAHKYEGFGPGKSVIIQGSGPMGALTLLSARMAGAGEITVVGGPEERLKLCRELGADHTINVFEVTRSEDRIREAKKFTRAEAGADVVFEVAGVPTAFREGLEMVRKAGKFIELGHYTDTGCIEVNPCKHFCEKDITLEAVFDTPTQQFYSAIRTLSFYHDKYPFKKLVTHKFKLDEAAEAIETMKKGECMKAVFIPSIKQSNLYTPLPP